MKASIVPILGYLFSQAPAAQAVVYPSNINVAPAGSRYQALVGLENLKTGVSLQPDATGVFTGITEIHLAPSEVVVETNEITGRNEIRYLPAFDNAGRINGLTVQLNLIAGWSDSTLEAIRIKYPTAAQFQMTAASSRFVMEDVTSATGEVLATIAYPGASPDQLSTPGLSTPVQIRLSKRGLEEYVCALTVAKQVRDKEIETGVTPSVEADPMVLLFGQLNQTYDVAEQDPFTNTFKTKNLKHNVPVRLSSEDDTAEGNTAEQEIFRRIGSLGLNCNLPLQPAPSNPAVKVPAVSSPSYQNLIVYAITFLGFSKYGNITLKQGVER